MRVCVLRQTDRLRLRSPDATMVALRVVVCFAVLAAAAASPVEQCPGELTDNLDANVQLHPCKKSPCKLRKGTDQSISINFIPATDTSVIKNSVQAEVLGVPLPFIGVDGASICDKIFLESGDKAGCPLKAGTKYTYKDSFPILSIYPSITVKVHWGLLNEQGKNIICFQVPAMIK